MGRLREDVAATVRRAAGLTFVHAAEPLSIKTLVDALDSPELTPEVLAEWAAADDWEGQRAATLDTERARQEAAERRRNACLASIEALHNQALRLQRGLRPRSWEAAATIQMRCAETLREWNEAQARAAAPEPAATAPAEAPLPAGAWAEMSDDDWQNLAHAALSGRKRKAEDETGEGGAA